MSPYLSPLFENEILDDTCCVGFLTFKMGPFSYALWFMNFYVAKSFAYLCASSYSVPTFPSSSPIHFTGGLIYLPKSQSIRSGYKVSPRLRPELVGRCPRSRLFPARSSARRGSHDSSGRLSALLIFPHLFLSFSLLSMKLSRLMSNPA